MKVADSMTREVRACTVHDSLNAAARVMWEHDCGCVPVVDGQGRLVGIVTDRDICMAAYTQGVPLEAIAVERVMAARVISCSRTDDLETAHRLMRKHEIHRLPGGRFARPPDRHPVAERRCESGEPSRRRTVGSRRNHRHALRDPQTPRRRSDSGVGVIQRRRAIDAEKTAEKNGDAKKETVRRPPLNFRLLSLCGDRYAALRLNRAFW